MLLLSHNTIFENDWLAIAEIHNHLVMHLIFMRLSEFKIEYNNWFFYVVEMVVRMERQWIL